MALIRRKREPYEELRCRRWEEDIGWFHSLVIVPEKELHESGYRCMSFVAYNEHNEPIVKIGGGSDVLHLGGIGGWNDDLAAIRKNGNPPWSIDCLPNGCLRVFNNRRLRVGPDLSSMELFYEELKEGRELRREVPFEKEGSHGSFVDMIEP
jgi:hypothetical protein